MEDTSYLVSVIIVIILVLIVFWYDHLSQKRTILRENMRKLWLNEILWMKSYTTDLIENQDSGAENATLMRLTKNHQAMSDLIYKYYNEGNSRKFLIKMDGSSVLYGTLIKETLNNELNKAKSTWSMMLVNGKDLAMYLSIIPGACKKKLAKMMDTYNHNLSQVFTTRISRDWVKNNNAVDAALNHATDIADYLSYYIGKDQYSLISF